MDLSQLQPLHLLGGQCMLSEDPARFLRTVLGSCVCACIYDPFRGLGGMNHFILDQGGADEPFDRRYRYGDTAMRSLVESLYSRGARHSDLRAKLYGGRLRRDDYRDPGALNAAFALSFLEQNDISLVDASLGGHVARWVTFHPVTGRVWLKELADVAPVPSSSIAFGSSRDLPAA